MQLFERQRRFRRPPQGEGKVGDGINAAVFARSDLGLAMGFGTEAAIENADLTLVRRSPCGG
jgi:Cd2+/Zn2+-exporting ATPase